MSMLGSFVKVLRASVAGKRTWTPAEVRDLIDRRELGAAREAAGNLSASQTQADAQRACLIGEICFQERRDDEAAAAFAEALRLAPSLPEAHHGLSLLLGERGQFEDAVRHAFFAHSAARNTPRFLAQLGYCNLRLQNYPQAEAPLRRATLLAPSDSYAWNNLGIVLRARGDFAESVDCFRRACALRPDDRSAQENLAKLEAELKTRGPESTGLAPEAAGTLSAGPPALHAVRVRERDGFLLEAIDLCEAVVLEQPEAAEPVLELYRLYQRAGDPQSGIDALEAFRSAHPDDTGVIAALGIAKLEMRELAAAEALLLRAASARPESLDLVLGIAQALTGQERFGDAAPWFEQALALAPDDVKTRALRAANLVNQCRYEEGLAACQALEQEGLHIPALGIVLAYLGRLDEAMAALDTHVERYPNDPHLRFHRGSVRLLQLDFAGGWDDYSYRGFSMSENFRVLPFPLWRGEPLQGRKIVVLAEQGLGDQVMFASCLPDLLQLGAAEVVVEAIRRIAPTIQRSFPDCRVIATSQSRRLEWVADCPDMDYYVPLGDLPRYFRRSLADFPARKGFLRADPARVEHWRRQLAAVGPGPYVGISWKGGTEGTRTSLRSMDVTTFTPLASVRPATWVCLQYGAVDTAIQAAADTGFPLAYWPEAIADLDEFAALVTALDLVITVCNTTVHYAGAVSTPVWVLAPSVPEWRYGATNEQLPWYPSSTIFRQPKLGDWQATLERVCHELSVWNPPSWEIGHAQIASN